MFCTDTEKGKGRIIKNNVMLDDHKLYWHLDRVLAWQEGELVPPIYVEVSPTNRCNHKCIFCGINFAQEIGDSLLYIPTEHALFNLGKLGCRSILFAGEGEPLLHVHLFDMMLAAKTRMDVALTTNGVLGDFDRWYDILCLLSWLRISVDAGNASAYARLHGTKEADFHAVVNNIQRCVGIKRQLCSDVAISAQFVIVEQNLRYIEQFLELFSRVGLDYISLKPFSRHPKMLNECDVAYDETTIRNIGYLAMKYNKSVNVIFREEAMKSYSRGIKFSHCYALPFWGYISSNGDFYSCSVHLGDERFKVGNIYEDSMEEILFGDRRKESIDFAANELDVQGECRVNCRMARVNEFLELILAKPEHVNFI